MTAEIAILNKNAVALAADSAVTLRNPQTQKVYNTANKLFMLSKYHPVGIMVHGPAEIMGVPWETVIKTYRQQLETTNFNRLIEFAENFVSFLEGNELLFPERLRLATFAGLCEWPLGQIKNAIDARVQAQIATLGEIDDDGINRITSEIVDEHLQNWRRYDRLSCFPEGFEEDFLRDSGAFLNEKLDAIFMELPIDSIRPSLLEICALRATKEWWSLGSGGIVIAGFGKDDVFPVLHSYTVETIVRNKLKQMRRIAQSNDMNESNTATIIPFAQAEIVYRFIQGIDPEYHQEFDNFIRDLLITEYPETLLRQFGERLSEDQRRDVEAELIRLGRAVHSNFGDKWSDWQFQKFVSPVLDIVADLPKDDLAAMAESLVNLTSFKRRITAEVETVGGPIDRRGDLEGRRLCLD